jgi:hypothetical protein
LLILALPWYAKGHKDDTGVVTYPNAVQRSWPTVPMSHLADRPLSR